MGKKHTEKEWAWQKFGDCYYLTAQHGMREIIIGSNIVDGTHMSYPSMNDDGILKPINPQHPNSKLIAAAPDLLEAAQNALRTLKSFDIRGDAQNGLREAIEKATS